MNTKNKTVRILSVLLMIAVITATFIACGDNEGKVNETSDFITTEVTTHSTTEETTTAETTTTETEPIETTAESTTETTTKKTIVTTAEVTTKKKVVTTTETTTKKPVDEEYERMLSKLNKELAKKEYPEEAVKLFHDVFDYLYKNYSGWRKGYRDLPSREKYITENLINVIEKINKVNFYDENSEEGKALLEDGSPGAFTSVDEDYGLYIEIIAPKAGTEPENKREEDIECFLHEIIHCKHYSTADTTEKYDWFYEIIEEGGATFHMKFIYPLSYEKMGAWTVSYNGIDIEYTKNNAIGYLLYMNAYEKLVYLVGYEMMEKIGCFKLPFSAAKEKIAEKYGVEQTEKFLNVMAEWAAEYENSFKGEKVFNLALEFEEMFLGFMEQDIAELKTKEEAKKYKSVFDFYMKKNLPDVVDTNGTKYKNVTSEYFDTVKLRKSLEEKLR